jgi:hypothetical protein
MVPYSWLNRSRDLFYFLQSAGYLDEIDLQEVPGFFSVKNQVLDFHWVRFFFVFEDFSSGFESDAMKHFEVPIKYDHHRVEQPSVKGQGPFVWSRSRHGLLKVQISRKLKGDLLNPFKRKQRAANETKLVSQIAK